MIREPTVSVAIAAYGHAQYIGRTLESLLGQTRPPAEVIVINDGSPDATREAVKPYLDRITYVEQNNRGFIATMNRATAMARGEYLLQFSSDDWLEPDALEALAGVLDRHSDVGIVHGAVRFVDSDGHPIDRLRWVTYPIGKHRRTPELIRRNFIPATATLLRRVALVDAGLELPDVALFHDWAVWLSLALRGWSLYGLDRTVTYYRRHDRNLSAAVDRGRGYEGLLRLAEEIERRFAGTLSAPERRAFTALKRQARRKMALASLERGERREARSGFATLLARDHDLRAGLGLALSVMPASALRLLEAVDRRLMRHDNRLAIRLKQLF